ncbi:MAG: hypothetical protein HC810_01320 [Acaryochloridaceae cyanobacterium RL_2_7]|nr:hypothetical protein [Acaryochloridaceae cyanobacterium RL_2_7]
MVPSQLAPKKSILGEIRPNRMYSDHGWIHYHGNIIGQIQGLQLEEMSQAQHPFLVNARISVGCPLSFEISSDQPLPPRLMDRAVLCYQFNPRASQHFALFRNVCPRFIRIYPLNSTATLANQMQAFLQEEACFLAQNQRDFNAQEFYQQHCPPLASANL